GVHDRPLFLWGGVSRPPAPRAQGRIPCSPVWAAWILVGGESDEPPTRGAFARRVSCRERRQLHVDRVAVLGERGRAGVRRAVSDVAAAGAPTRPSGPDAQGSCRAGGPEHLL